MEDGGLKRETEILIMTAQEQAIRSNVIKAKIDRSQTDSKCRMCGQVDETMNHITSELSKLAQKEYKKQHDWVGKRIHWEVCNKFDIVVTEKWYEHQPQPVMENESNKILWDFRVQTDNVIEARHPDLITIDKARKHGQIIDFAVPFDSKVAGKKGKKQISIRIWQEK